jgi:hypothetical protein
MTVTESDRIVAGATPDVVHGRPCITELLSLRSPAQQKEWQASPEPVSDVGSGSGLGPVGNRPRCFLGRFNGSRAGERPLHQRGGGGTARPGDGRPRPVRGLRGRAEMRVLGTAGHDIEDERSAREGFGWLDDDQFADQAGKPRGGGDALRTLQPTAGGREGLVLQRRHPRRCPAAGRRRHQHGVSARPVPRRASSCPSTPLRARNRAVARLIRYNVPAVQE